MISGRGCRVLDRPLGVSNPIALTVILGTVDQVFASPALLKCCSSKCNVIWYRKINQVSQIVATTNTPSQSSERCAA